MLCGQKNNPTLYNRLQAAILLPLIIPSFHSFIHSLHSFIQRIVERSRVIPKWDTKRAGGKDFQGKRKDTEIANARARRAASGLIDSFQICEGNLSNWCRLIILCLLETGTKRIQFSGEKFIFKENNYEEIWTFSESWNWLSFRDWAKRLWTFVL